MKPLSHMNLRLPSRAGVIGLILLTLLNSTGCKKKKETFVKQSGNIAAFVQSRIQSEINKLWHHPATNSKLEKKAEKEIDKSLEKAFKYKKLINVPGPDPYIRSFYNVDVELGSKAPKITIPPCSTVETTKNIYLLFKWKAHWGKGNGAHLKFSVDIHKGCTPLLIPPFVQCGFPDIHVKVHNLSAQAGGWVWVKVPKKTGKVQVKVHINHVDVNLKAKAKTWFLTADISKKVKAQVEQQLVRKTLELALKKGALGLGF